MKLEIVRYNDTLEKSWDDFVANSVNGTFLHSRAFFNHNPLNQQDDFSFLYYKKNRIIAVVPCALYEKNGQKIVHSHLRATYGGFVVGTEVGIEEALEMVELLLQQARQVAANQVIIRNSFRIFHQTICDETDYVMWQKGFQIKSRELEFAVDLKPDLLTIRNNYQNGAKYNIKKAIKSVQSAETEDFASFWTMLEANLQEKHGTKPVHSLVEFQTLLQNVGNQQIKLFGGFVDGKLACGVVVFLFRNRAIHAQYIASDNAYQDLRPLNAVLDFIIEWGHQNGYHYFNLGMANEEQGKIINLGLAHFKEGFGAKGTLRETMELTL